MFSKNESKAKKFFGGKIVFFKVGYIYISLFAANTYEQFVAKLNELEKNGIDALIIDVRDLFPEAMNVIIKNKVLYSI